MRANYVFSSPGSSIPTVRVPRGDGVPTITKGGPQYSSVDRPKRVAATEYTGTAALGMDVPVLFDGMSGGFGNDTSVETDINNLRRMYSAPNGIPIIVRINESIGGGLPIDPSGFDFVIENISWGSNYVVWDFDDGGTLVRFRQDAVVSLLEWVDPELLKVGAAGAGTGNKSNTATPLGALHKTHLVKSGETLTTIAIIEYGDRSKWRAIGQAQKPAINDPRNVKTGQILRLP